MSATTTNGEFKKRLASVAAGGQWTGSPFQLDRLMQVQNDAVEASPALRERIMGMHFDKSRFGPAGKTAGEQLARADVENVSGFLIHVIRREAEIMKTYHEVFRGHEERLGKLEGVHNGRLIKNHAQLASMLDAMRLVVTNLSDTHAAETHAFIGEMLRDRQRAVEDDHPHVELFWERFDHMRSIEAENTDKPIDHSRTSEVHAISLVQFEQRCADLRLSLPCTIIELKRLLKTSKKRKFIAASKPTNSRVAGKTVNCWVFKNPDHLPTPAY